MLRQGVSSAQKTSWNVRQRKSRGSVRSREHASINSVGSGESAS